MFGKQKCKALREIRKQIAEENEIKYVVSKCTYRGECNGTCPRCEEELRYLEEELEKRRRLKDDDKTTFLMREAYTYVNIDAELKVRPLMMTLPFMKDLTDTNLSGEDWYTVKYEGVLGY